MKSKFTRALLFAFVISALSVLTAFSVSAKTVTKNKLVYDIKGTTATLVECKSNAKKITVPSKVGKYKVTSIGEWAFSEKKNLTSVTLPSTVTKIGKAAFNECTALKKIVIPSSVKKIGAGAFWYCKELESVLIPKSVKSLGKDAFEGCEKLTVYVVKGSKAEKYVKKQKDISYAYRYMTSLSLSASSLTVEEGKTASLTVKKKPSKLYNGKVLFSSDNASVASVSSKGVITAKKAGTAVITCKAKDGSGKKAVCTVTVTAKTVVTEPSTKAPGTTVQEKPTVQEETTAAAVVNPVKVKALTVSDITTTGYTLFWEGDEINEGYIISRYNPTDESWSDIADVKETSCTVTDRTPGSQESYRITSYMTKDNERIYAEASDTVTAAVLVAGRVTDVQVISLTESAVTLSWAKDENASGYKIYLYDEETEEYIYKWATQETQATVTGLMSATEYTFAVRSYVRSSAVSLDCSEYSDNINVKTLAGRVGEITADEELVYSDSLTLSWNEVEGADGYNIYIYNKETGAYELYDSTTELTMKVEGLLSDTEYFFRIKTFVGEGDEINEGSFSESFTFGTDFIPDAADEAARSFIDALYNTEYGENSFLLSRTFSVSDIQTENSEEIEDILSSLSQRQTVMYEVENGCTADGQSSYELIYPYERESDISLSDIDTENMTFSVDGLGYTMQFTLAGDRADELVCPTDFEGVSEENEGFTLISYDTGDATVQAKTDNGLISWMKISVPVTVVFAYNSERYEVSYRLSQNYLFT